MTKEEKVAADVIRHKRAMSVYNKLGVTIKDVITNEAWALVNDRVAAAMKEEFKYG